MENDNFVEMLSILERSYKNKTLEGLLESQEYFLDTSLEDVYIDFKSKARTLLVKLKTIAIRNEMFETIDKINELLDNSK